MWPALEADVKCLEGPDEAALFDSQSLRSRNPLYLTSVPALEYVPRRAMMYIPGSDERKLQKIPSLGCDCAVLDMEDGVSQNRKQEARANIVNALSNVCEL